MKASLILPRTSNQQLFGGNFCEHQLVLGKLLNNVKWSTVCVSFICTLTIFSSLWCFEIFKIDYLETSNVQFETVSINPVTSLQASLYSVLSSLNRLNFPCVLKLPHGYKFFAQISRSRTPSILNLRWICLPVHKICSLKIYLIFFAFIFSFSQHFLKFL